MPKFSPEERQAITAALLAEGERLFCAAGLKKVTVEDIARAAAIAKGSFYAFYPSKEALYFAILTRCQQDMWGKMDAWLENHAEEAPRTLVQGAMGFVLGLMPRYPLIRRTDNETMALLLRKLPREVTDHHTGEDTEAVERFFRYGVRFTQPPPVVAKAFQVLYGAVLMLEKEEDAMMERVVTVMTQALVNQLVEETR